MLPKDPIMLLSYINTQLRDNYDSLKELCRSMDEEEEEIVRRLSEIGYSYDPDRNHFLRR